LIIEAIGPDEIVVEFDETQKPKIGDTYDVFRYDRIVRNGQGKVKFRTTQSLGMTKVAAVPEDGGALLKIVSRVTGTPQISKGHFAGKGENRRR
jgi:hypothetical protein